MDFAGNLLCAGGSGSNNGRCLRFLYDGLQGPAFSTTKSPAPERAQEKWLR